MLDSKIRALKNFFGIAFPNDWCDVEPAMILSVPGVGPVTLDHLRIYLSAHNLTLRGDRTPEFWKANLSAARIGHTLGDETDPELAGQIDGNDVTPFTILIDSQEKAPFSFTGFTWDADKGGRPMLVDSKSEYLGKAQGDYQLEQFRGLASIERKSTEDLVSTVLGWGERRDRFEEELQSLNAMEFAAVVCEGTFGDCLNACRQWGTKTADQNKKSLFRSVLAYQHEYRNVHWCFCDGRRLAEITTFRHLERFWDGKLYSAKEAAKAKLKETRAAAGNNAAVLAAVRKEGGCD